MVMQLFANPFYSRRGSRSTADLGSHSHVDPCLERELKVPQCDLHRRHDATTSPGEPQEAAFETLHYVSGGPQQAGQPDTEARAQGTANVVNHRTRGVQPDRPQALPGLRQPKHSPSQAAGQKFTGLDKTRQATSKAAGQRLQGPAQV